MEKKVVEGVRVSNHVFDGRKYPEARLHHGPSGAPKFRLKIPKTKIYFDEENLQRIILTRIIIIALILTGPIMAE